MYCIKKNRKVLSSAYHEDQAVKNQLTFRFSSSKDYRECLSGDEFLSGFESGISHNNPDAMQDHCVIM